MLREGPIGQNFIAWPASGISSPAAARPLSRSPVTMFEGMNASFVASRVASLYSRSHVPQCLAGRDESTASTVLRFWLTA